MSKRPHTPLMMAVMEGVEPRLVQHALATMIGASEWVDVDDPNMGITPLMACAFRPDALAAGMAALLVDAGASVHRADGGHAGIGPLFLAAQENKPLLAEFLCSLGARCDAVGHASPTTPLHIAAQNGAWRCAAAMLRAARAGGYLDTAIERENRDGRSACYVAVEMAHCELAGALAAAGADLKLARPAVYSFADPADPDTVRHVDPTMKLPTHGSLDRALQSRCLHRCAACRAGAERLLKCGGCGAQYCSRDCQRGDWVGRHKLVCARVEAGARAFRAAAPERAAEPAAAAQFGFNDAFGDADDVGGDGYDRAAHPKWEYDAGPRGGGREKWLRFPPRVEAGLERLAASGSPHFLYKPGAPENDGFTEAYPSRNPPPKVATHKVSFEDMSERNVYTGASRAVRRDGHRRSLKAKNPAFGAMRQGFL